MQKKDDDLPEDITPDLRHDTMEYAASTEGDDILDTDTEEEEITADELDVLEDAPEEEQTNALNTVEKDRTLDDDVIFDENDKDETFDDINTDEEEDEDL